MQVKKDIFTNTYEESWIHENRLNSSDEKNTNKRYR